MPGETRTVPADEFDGRDLPPLRILADSAQGPIHVYGDDNGGVQVFWRLDKDVVELTELSADEVAHWGSAP